jgi:15-hydroxyprostaglandin dehydrogenase (NAD)
MVPTGLAPPGLMERVPKEHVTPMNTILRAFDELMDGKANRNGECVEAVMQDLFYRTPPEPMGESQKWMKKGAAEFWTEVYRERNVGFVNAKRSKL